MRGLLTGGIGFALGIALALVFEDKPTGRADRGLESVLLEERRRTRDLEEELERLRDDAPAAGANDNRSWNCGVEGPTDDPAVERLRNRQVKNFLTVTLLSLGVPMILMGDEARRTQRGNNNAYCLDDETSWFDWGLLPKHADVHRFVTLLNARRVLRAVEHERGRVSLTEFLRRARNAWHGVKLGQPDWGEHSHSLAHAAELPEEGLSVYLILNAYWEPLVFELPAVGDGGTGSWRRWVDTSLEFPNEIVPWQEAPPHSGHAYRAGARSVVVLFAEARGHEGPAPLDAAVGRFT